MTKKYFVIETQSTFQIRYAICTEQEPANGRFQHLIDDGNIKDFSQHFLGEKIVGVQEMKEDDLIAYVARDFPDLVLLPRNVQLTLVNQIDQESVEMLTTEESQSI